MFIDIVAAILISLGFYLGYQRGLIKTVFDTLSLFIGILCALKLSPWMMDLLESIFNMHRSIKVILGVALTFLLVMVIIRFIGKKLEDLLEVANINFVNKIAGGALQALFFATILSYSIALVDKVNGLKEETKKASITYPALNTLPAISTSLFNSMKPMFTEFWKRTNETVDGLKKPEDQQTK